ncbi:hypothetical protein [Alkalibacillus aidingensis]|uniref:hypothetical protein n=1 Tax=Alkalibacillus aidingensis TaxID=2747607 RepID=UPI0016604559|nr:hypothetical protein [Alkalibacillus aidingensis]
MSKYENKDIEKLLSEMPQIKDQQTFDHYYDKIAEQLDENVPKRHKKPVWMPLLATAAGLFLAFIVGMQFFGSGSQMEDASTFDANMGQSTTEEREGSEVEKNTDDDANNFSSMDEAEHFNEDTAEDSGMESEITDVNLESKALYVDEDEANQFVTLYIPDHQLEYLVPVTVPNPTNQPYESIDYITEIFDQMDEFQSSLYEPIQYIGDHEDGQPIIEIDNDVTDEYVGGSSAENLLITGILSFFDQFGIDLVRFQSDQNETAMLSHFGEFDQLEVPEREPEIYRLKEVDEDRQSYLVPEQIEPSYTFEEALEMMKEGNETLDIKSTIYEDLELVINELDQQTVSIELDPSEPLEPSEDLLTMIEAILFTAKSYGYQYVEFDTEDSIDHLNQYLLNGSTEVPDYINPLTR